MGREGRCQKGGRHGQTLVPTLRQHLVQRWSLASAGSRADRSGGGGYRAVVQCYCQNIGYQQTAQL